MLVVTTQPSSVATAGVNFATQPVVAEEDFFGNIITSDSTHLVTAISTGTDVLHGTVTLTFVNGIAAFSDLSYNKAETISIGFATNASGVAATTSSSIIVTAATASQLVILTQPSSTATAGVAFATQPIVAEEDAFGNIITSDSTHTITATRGSHGNASLQGATLTLTLANGIATFTGLAYDKAEAMNITFTTSAGGVNAATSDDVLVSPAAASKLTVTTQPSPAAIAGIDFAVQPVVTEEDAFGNVITTDSTSTVTVARGSLGSAALQGGPFTLTLSSGVATFSSLSYNVAETINLLFTDSDSGVTPVTSNNIVVSPNVATQLVFGQQPTGGIAGIAIAANVTALIADAYGNIETADSSSSVTLAIASGPGTIASGATATVSAGVASFANLTLNTVGTYTLQASTAGLPTSMPVSSSFTISPNVAAKLVFGQQPTDTPAGSAITPAVTLLVEDAFDNLVTTDTSSVALLITANPASGILGGTTTVNAVGGIATFSDLSIDKFGTGYQFTAFDGGLTSAVSSFFDIATAGAPTIWCSSRSRSARSRGSRSIR